MPRIPIIRIPRPIRNPKSEGLLIIYPKIRYMIPIITPTIPEVFPILSGEEKMDMSPMINMKIPTM